MLQLVPLSLLASVRASATALDRARQAQALGGLAPPPRRDAADRIAEANHATVAANVDAVLAKLAEIAADRAKSYAAIGITAGST